MTQSRHGAVCQLPEAGGTTSGTVQEITRLGRATGSLPGACVSVPGRPPPVPPRHAPTAPPCGPARPCLPRPGTRASDARDGHLSGPCSARFRAHPQPPEGWGGEHVLARFRKFPTARVVSEPSGGRRSVGRRCSVRLGCPHCAHAQWLRRAPRQSCGASERASGGVVQLSGFCGSLQEAAQELGISRKGQGREGEWGGSQVGEGRGAGLHLAGSRGEHAAGGGTGPGHRGRSFSSAACTPPLAPSARNS